MERGELCFSVCGEKGCGKSRLIARLVDDVYYDPAYQHTLIPKADSEEDASVKWISVERYNTAVHVVCWALNAAAPTHAAALLSTMLSFHANVALHL